MQEKLKMIESQYIEKIQNLVTLKDSEMIKVELFGKNGLITELMKGLKNASNEDKPVLGNMINQVKNRLQELLDEKIVLLKNAEIDNKLKQDIIDVTLPTKKELGGRHPLSVVIEKIVKVFKEMGFSIYYGNEMEENEYNFDKLNIPSDHPARDSQDTFYLNDRYLLRSQTTTFQARVMSEYKPPIKMMTFGKVYRGDEPDATHSPIFNQLDVMVIDKDICLADLKGFLQNFVEKMFGREIKFRMRPSFFPFTEPSVEIDLTCLKCGGKGCALCKQSGWLEVLAGGVMNEKVLQEGGIDTNVYSGFALGIGIERIAMALANINDIRYLYDNDIRMILQNK